MQESKWIFIFHSHAMPYSASRAHSLLAVGRCNTKSMLVPSVKKNSMCAFSLIKGVSSSHHSTIKRTSPAASFLRSSSSSIVNCLHSSSITFCKYASYACCCFLVRPVSMNDTIPTPAMNKMANISSASGRCSASGSNSRAKADIIHARIFILTAKQPLKSPGCSHRTPRRKVTLCESDTYFWADSTAE